jgi:hypothetical protein
MPLAKVLERGNMTDTNTNEEEIEKFIKTTYENDVKDFVVSPLSIEFRTSIKKMDKKEKTENIEVLIFVSVASNIYILNILSALLKFLKDVFHENKEVTIKINFLLLPEIIKFSKSIRDSFIKHNEKVVPNIREHEEILRGLIKVTSANFKSTVNTVLLGLEDYKEKMNDIICNYINFVDIDDYYKEDRIDRNKFEEEVKKNQNTGDVGTSNGNK